MELCFGNIYCFLGIPLCLFAVQCHLLDATFEVYTSTLGSQVTLRCQGEPGVNSTVEWDRQTPGFKVICKKCEKLRNISDRFTLDRDFSSGKCNLVIKNVTFDDAGKYSCTDGFAYEESKLIVFDKYPSDLHCSVRYPSDGILVDDVCGLESDFVELTCGMSYTDNADLSPYMQWSLDGNVTPSIVTIDGLVTYSTTRISAAKIRSFSSIECRVKYKNDKADSSLIWSTHVNATIIRNIHVDSYIEVSCNQHIVTCPALTGTECTYSWWDDNKSIKISNQQLDLRQNPIGNYTCVPLCRIRHKICSYSAQRIHLSCNETNSNSPALRLQSLSAEGSQHTAVAIGVVVPICSLISIIVLVIVLRRRFRPRMHREPVDDRNAVEDLLESHQNRASC